MKSEKNLQAEQLEERLNLSGMQFGAGHHYCLPLILGSVTQRQSPTHVISIGSGSTTGQSAVKETKHELRIERRALRMAKNTPVRTPSRKTPVVVAPATSSNTPSNTPSTTPSTSSPTETTPSISAPDPLAPILALLHGDDVHDDSATIQLLVDTANADGIKNITLPAGTFLLNSGITFYGSGITFSGQGASTILDVNSHYTGTGSEAKGCAFNITATLDTNPLMIAQTVTGNTIVFRGTANLQVGQSLYLSNGLESTALVEARNGGTLTAPGEFHEDGPSEYVTIASITTDAQGNTIAHLMQNVMGTDDYFNVAPSGVTSGHYLHAAAITTPADHLTLENLSIQFKDLGADSAIGAKFTNNLTIQNVNVLNKTLLGGLGGFDLVSSTNMVLSNITCPANIALNSTRLASITNCTACAITLEEACTDNMISHNTLTGTTSCDFRINDAACERNVFEYNTLHGGVLDSSAIAIAGGD